MRMDYCSYMEYRAHQHYSQFYHYNSYPSDGYQFLYNEQALCFQQSSLPITTQVGPKKDQSHKRNQSRAYVASNTSLSPLLSLPVLLYVHIINIISSGSDLILEVHINSETIIGSVLFIIAFALGVVPRGLGGDHGRFEKEAVFNSSVDVVGLKTRQGHLISIVLTVWVAPASSEMVLQFPAAHTLITNSLKTWRAVGSYPGCSWR
jgi:hypothetical protein